MRGRCSQSYMYLANPYQSMTECGIWGWLPIRTARWRAFLAFFPWSRHNRLWILRPWHPFLRLNPCSKHFDDFTWDPSGRISIGYGNTGLVERLDCGHVRKCATFPNDRRWWLDRVDELQREYEVYQRIGKRPDFLQMIDFSAEKGLLILQALPSSTLRNHLSKQLDTSISRRLLWAMQIADAVQTLHSLAVLHCDIKPANVLLDDTLRAHLIDFAGSAIDEKPPIVMEEPRFRLPCADLATIRTDMFALGSSIFEIMTGRIPYADVKDDDEIERLYRAKSFPDTASIACGDVILKCWRGDFDTVGAVCGALDECYQRNKDGRGPKS